MYKEAKITLQYLTYLNISMSQRCRGDQTHERLFIDTFEFEKKTRHTVLAMNCPVHFGYKANQSQASVLQATADSANHRPPFYKRRRTLPITGLHSTIQV